MNALTTKANKCFFCKSSIQEETTHAYMVEENNSIIIIKNTPCLKCSECGEVFYTDEVASVLESVTTHLNQTVKSELLVTDYKTAILSWDPDYTKTTEFEKTELTKIEHNDENHLYHAHCPVCTKAYATNEEVENCFNSHTELEILRWVSNCIHNDKIWQSDNLKKLDYQLWETIENISLRFHISDNDY